MRAKLHRLGFADNKSTVYWIKFPGGHINDFKQRYVLLVHPLLGVNGVCDERLT